MALRRSVVSSASFPLAPSVLWRGVGIVLALAAVFVLRACDYDFGTVGLYVGYVAAYVALPGLVAMYVVNRGPLSLVQVVALALPTGFAIEIFTFLGLSALHAKSAFVWTPLFWLALAVLLGRRERRPLVRWRITAHHAGIWLGLSVAFLSTAVMAASQMFAESPLADGLPTRAIFHDWVYLVSRAGVIKNNWPLDDPSLSGTPLQYHYFMMVHAAAASWTTGIEISAVMLRLIFFPLGAVLVAQAYILGRAVSRSAWGGVLAALLVVATSEMSFAASYGRPMFLGLFARWLFVSPTFFFGMIFCGALLLAIARCARDAQWRVRNLLWLLLLGAAGTGAKGTLLPVIVCALGVWALWRWRVERKFPWRLLGLGVVLTAAFAVVYWPTMSAWRTGDARLRPFHVFALTEFWKHYLPLWQAWLAQWLPKQLANSVAMLGCAAVVFAGTCGVRLLAVPYLFWGERTKHENSAVQWLGSFFVAATGMGLLLELNSYGELYVILMIRLPMAVLTAAFFVAGLRRLRVAWQRSKEAASDLPWKGTASSRRWLGIDRTSPVQGAFLATAIGVSIVAGGIQTSLWWTRNQTGLREWLSTPTDLKPDDYMRNLEQALLWVRHHTAPNAVLVANACTPENMKKDHWGALDRTLTGVHFYYSALSERRLWFEGPNYILDTTRERIRANLASNFFYRGRRIAPEMVNRGPCYALVDRSLQDGAKVDPPQGRQVFSNERIEIYEISRDNRASVDHLAVSDGL